MWHSSRVNESHATHTFILDNDNTNGMSHPASPHFDFGPYVFMSRPAKNRRLSWPGWLQVTYGGGRYDRLKTVTHPSINRARRRVTAVLFWESRDKISKFSYESQMANSTIWLNNLKQTCKTIITVLHKFWRFDYCNCIYSWESLTVISTEYSTLTVTTSI